MAELEFEDLFFEDEESKVKVTFLKAFCFYIGKAELLKIGNYRAEGNRIVFDKATEKQARNKLNFILEDGFTRLESKVTARKAVYIHKNSGIPLIGSVYFGIIERGTNIIEIRPITGCNLNCIYCSVDEGVPSKRQMDFVVEKDYLVSELKKVIEYKKCSDIDIHINSQGEPLLYADIVSLVGDIKQIKDVKVISVDTNGTLLTKKLIDELSQAGLSRINLSLNSLDSKTASKMANRPYNTEKVMDMAAYAAEKMDIILAPVLLKGYNDKDMSGIIKFARKIGAGKRWPAVGIQNFLRYKSGRNNAEEISMDEFYMFLDSLEKEHGISLRVKDGFNIVKTKEFPKPFRRKDCIQAEIVLPGRLKNEKIACSMSRLITVPKCFKEGNVRLKITRAKHNIFFGEIV